jgi:hypothetical protein
MKEDIKCVPVIWEEGCAKCVHGRMSTYAPVFTASKTQRMWHCHRDCPVD